MMKYDLPGMQGVGSGSSINLNWEYSEVNRLILIGNGFDLAHGLKTSFKDFIEDYSLKILNELKGKYRFEGELFSIASEVNFEDLKNNLDSLEKSLIYKKFLDVLQRDRIKIEHQSEFLESIFLSIEKKSWVDIEMVFLNC